jgi:hypothetical protein
MPDFKRRRSHGLQRQGQLAANPKRPVHEAIIKIGALAYWDAHLKGDQMARDWLACGGFAAWIADEASYRYDPPPADKTLEKRSG